MSKETSIKVPTADMVTPQNQEIFKSLESALGFVPNLYAAMAHSKNALGNFLTHANGATSFSKKEKEVIDLAVSNVNNCSYCQAAHTAIAKMNGFTDEQALELRKGKASWDTKLNTLGKISRAMSENRGNLSKEMKAEFFAAGYNEENLIDLVVAVGIITTTNFMHNVTGVEVDFPAVPEV